MISRLEYSLVHPLIIYFGQNPKYLLYYSENLLKEKSYIQIKYHSLIPKKLIHNVFDSFMKEKNGKIERTKNGRHST